MDGNFFKGLFSRVAGREPQDEVEAAELAVELAGLRKKADSLSAELAAAASQVEELTAQLTAKDDRIAELEAEAEQSEVEAVVATALSEGRISPSQEAWAKDYADNDLDGFRTYLETVKAGTFAPPKGRVVTDEAIDSADTTSTAGVSITEHAENKAYAAEHKIPYHEAALILKKQREAARKGE
jgi:hypothetical protein